jgi:hypothetical protein
MMGAGNGIGWGENCVHLSPAHTGDFSTAQLPRISIFLGCFRWICFGGQARCFGHAGQKEISCWPRFWPGGEEESPIERTGRERRS